MHNKALSIIEGFVVSTESVNPEYKHMKALLLKDAVGSLLHKFFTQHIQTHEDEDYLVESLWQLVTHYRETGKFAAAIIVCPKYSPDYTRMVTGASVTALRAIKLVTRLKKVLGQHLSYGLKTQISVCLFDQENRGYNPTLTPVSDMDALVESSVVEIVKLIRQTGVLPACFTANTLVGAQNRHVWEKLVATARDSITSGSIQKTSIHDDPETVFKTLGNFYTRVLGSSNVSLHREMFDKEEGPSYLAGGSILRSTFGPNVLQIDVGSEPSLAALNRWQPPGETLGVRPILIRVKNPRQLD